MEETERAEPGPGPVGPAADRPAHRSRPGPKTSRPAGGVRARARAQLMADLLAAARTRLAAEGPAGLSLRAVARDLGVSSSAVYRYVDSRDALLTALIIEAYDEVGAECERAMGDAFERGLDPGATWLAVGHSFRRWALANRSSFELIYGTPVPGYAAPRDTVTAATRLWLVISDILLSAKARGELDPAGPDFDDQGLVGADVVAFAQEHVTASGARGLEVEPPTEVELARSTTLWVSLVGAVSAEVFGHLHGMTTDHARSFEITLATAAAGVGLRIDLSR